MKKLMETVVLSLEKIKGFLGNAEFYHSDLLCSHLLKKIYNFFFFLHVD